MLRIKIRLKKILPTLLITLLIVGVFLISFKFSLSSWDGQVSVSFLDPKGRSIATNNGNRSLAAVSGTAFDTQTLFENAKTVLDIQGIKFTVGNILTTDSLGNKRFICDRFDRISFSFQATSMMINGEPVLMKLTADCNQINNKEIGPFFIPHKKILSSSLDQRVFEENEGVVEFFNTSISWPNEWALHSIELKSSSEDTYKIQYQFSKEQEDKAFIINFAAS